MKLTLDKTIQIDARTASSPNLCNRFEKEDLERIGQHVKEGYERDLQSRSRWISRNRAAMDLALQIKPGKSFPWANASNVAFPLLTIAALQFHSRAYPALFSGSEIVKYRVPAVDGDGKLLEIASLVGRFMSYQAMEQDDAFEEQHDRLLIHVPIVGCGFIKSRREQSRRRNVSEFVPAEDLVIDYFAKSVNQAQRKTQHVMLYRNDVYERCASGIFRDILEEPWYTAAAAPTLPATQAEKDRIAGTSQPVTSDSDALLFLEQHTWLDLDGDGYAEPYIVTIENSSRAVVRIVARWELPEDVERVGNRILRIRATEYYTKYDLIPSPDGGIYGVGFGALIGPLNESVDTIVNQLIDAGTMSVAAGGFLSKGVKIRGGETTFKPFGWQHVEATGDDLRKGIFPFPVREPSAVLFNLLTLLINYTQRISGSTDVMVGENPGQNTPAHNMQAMLEQGMKIYSAIFKRLWRAMKEEFQKLFVLNARHLEDEVQFGTAKVMRAMFLQDPANLVPAADPNMVSDAAKLQQAVTIKQSAMSTPGYDRDAVEKHLLRTMKVDGIEVLFPGTEKRPPGPSEKLQLEQLKNEREQLKISAARQEVIWTLMEQSRLNDAKILQLEAAAAQALASAEVAQSQQQQEALNIALSAVRDHNKAITDRISAMMKGTSNGTEPSSAEGTPGRVAEPPDVPEVPVVSPLAPTGPDESMGLGSVDGGN